MWWTGPRTRRGAAVEQILLRLCVKGGTKQHPPLQSITMFHYLLDRARSIMQQQCATHRYCVFTGAFALFSNPNLLTHHMCYPHVNIWIRNIRCRNTHVNTTFDFKPNKPNEGGTEKFISWLPLCWFTPLTCWNSNAGMSLQQTTL